MSDFTVTVHVDLASRPEAFTITDPTGKVVWKAKGFATEAYLEQAVEIALRKLRGMKPRPVDYSEDLKPATVSIVKSWVAQWHPNPKRAA